MRPGSANRSRRGGERPVRRWTNPGDQGRSGDQDHGYGGHAGCGRSGTPGAAVGAFHGGAEDDATSRTASLPHRARGPLPERPAGAHPGRADRRRRVAGHRADDAPATTEVRAVAAQRVSSSSTTTSTSTTTRPRCRSRFPPRPRRLPRPHRRRPPPGRRTTRVAAALPRRRPRWSRPPRRRRRARRRLRLPRRRRHRRSRTRRPRRRRCPRVTPRTEPAERAARRARPAGCCPRVAVLARRLRLPDQRDDRKDQAERADARSR